MNKNFLNWFTGKSLENAMAAAELLETSMAQGFWVKGASRKVAAALSKSNVAQKTVKPVRAAIEKLGVPEGVSQYDSKFRDVARQGWEIGHCMYFGSFASIQKVDFAAARAAAAGTKLESVIEKAAQYAADFAEVAAAITKLDATRPAPVFTSLGLSPTVTATLKNLDAEKFEVCPIRWEERSKVDPKTGKTEFYMVGILLWPEGTKHHTSRYSFGTANNRQCHACGHAIRNMFNWVPLILWAKDGTAKSLWVGRDCAESLFGVKVTGEIDLATTEGR